MRDDMIPMCHHHYEEWKARERRRLVVRRVLTVLSFVVGFVLSSLAVQWLTGRWLF